MIYQWQIRTNTPFDQLARTDAEVDFFQQGPEVAPIFIEDVESSAFNVESESNVGVGAIYVTSFGSTYNDIFRKTIGANALIDLGQTSRTYSGITSTTEGNVYACVGGGDIYKQQYGMNNFTALGQTSRQWTGIACRLLDGYFGEHVYACVANGDIYKQTSGSGNFNALGQTSRQWTGITVTPSGNVYACVGGGDIYKQTGGSGAFNPLSQTSRGWKGLAAAPNGDVYAIASDGIVYKQTNGTGNFNAVTTTALTNIQAIAAAPSGDIFITTWSSDIYRIIGGSGSPVAVSQKTTGLGVICVKIDGEVIVISGTPKSLSGFSTKHVSVWETARNWSGICVSPVNGNVYACIAGGGGSIYVQTTGQSKFNVHYATVLTRYGMAAHQNGDLYETHGGGVGCQTGGAGSFNSVAGSPTNPRGICVSPVDGDVYVCDYGGNIYRRAGGSGFFNLEYAVAKNWWGMCAAPNGDIYASVPGGDIYKQTGGSGNFNALGQSPQYWRGMCALPNGDIYVCTNDFVTGGGIWKQTGGVGDFVLVENITKDFQMMAYLQYAYLT